MTQNILFTITYKGIAHFRVLEIEILSKIIYTVNQITNEAESFKSITKYLKDMLNILEIPKKYYFRFYIILHVMNICCNAKKWTEKLNILLGIVNTAIKIENISI